ncbi:nitrite reductase H large subunit [Amanita muscaria]
MDLDTVLAPIHARKTIVVVGLGMVALSFIEKIREYDLEQTYEVKVFSEEPHVAYNRVGLTQYFSHKNFELQYMRPRAWYDENKIHISLGDPVEEIDSERQQVRARLTGWVSYDILVLATGSSAAVPPGIPVDSVNGIFVYRTLQDLRDIVEWSQQDHVQHATVVGGGLLGLEAAKAVKDLGLQVTISERSNTLMSRQLDVEASRILQAEITKLGLTISIQDCPVEPVQDSIGRLKGARMTSKKYMETQVLIYAIGILARDQLADSCLGLSKAEHGGFAVNEHLETSLPNVYAIGECASHNDTTYGLVAPGYDMAEIVSRNLTTRRFESRKAAFKGSDMSTKLKLLGVHVASFGEYFSDESKTRALVYRDPFSGIYKKYIFTKEGKRLVGGMMVGDTNDYAKLLALVRSGQQLRSPPSELILGVQSAKESLQGADALPDETQICSCNNISKGQLRKVIRDKKCENLVQVKCFSRAGTGCGGCLPQVQEIFEAELQATGQTISNAMCAHFKYSRTEIFTIGKVKQLKTFEDFIKHVNNDSSHAVVGCEVCKPAIASILASLWNEHILNPGLRSLQDTNDKYLANIQRGGLYSIIPRIAAGETTPQKLAVIAEVAKEYDLYTKITGAQRIDLMGARKQDLPSIWEKLIDGGFESGHAYGKALRTVKSCVGTTWCRYGQQDSVGFAIKLENRYKGIRSPHKLKGGVSGCIRECAEAQGKDFGCIATDKGYNVYVCGNGGSKPKHAELLVADVSEEKAVQYLDRFLAYYIMTAERLTRTARWLEKMEGGIEYLRKVVVNDHLGICKELEEHIAQLIDTYQCEWTTVVRDPDRRRLFEEFVNTSEADASIIELVDERGQRRPADWPKEVPPMPTIDTILEKDDRGIVQNMSWVSVGQVDLFPPDEGRVVRIGDAQLAVFHAGSHWYATQNMCPHKRALVLASGLLGTNDQQRLYVSCPMHKKNFDVETGKCLVPGEQDKYKLNTFQVKIKDGQVHLYLPPVDVLNELLGSTRTIITKNMLKSKPTVVTCEETSACSNKALDW